MYILSTKKTRKEVIVQGQQELKDKPFPSCNTIHRKEREKYLIFCFSRVKFNSSWSHYSGFGFVGFFLFKFISLTFGPDQLEHPIARLMHLLGVVSGSNTCSGLDAISHLHAPVLYMRPGLYNRLYIFCGVLSTARQLEPSSPVCWAPSALAGRTTAGAQWFPGDWNPTARLCPCLCVKFIEVGNTCFPRMYCRNNETSQCFPRTSAPVTRKGHMSQMFSTFLPNTVVFDFGPISEVSCFFISSNE